MTRRPTGGNAVWWCVLLALCTVLLAPLTLAEVPPLQDYPNHLARLYALAFLPADPILARFYTSRWAIIPNLALDLTVPPMLRALPVHDVGRAVMGVALVLPVLGAAAYNRALAGQLSYWPLGCVLFVYNGALLRGFLNFIISVGLALLFAAAWLAWRERTPARAILIGAAGAVVLFFCHLIGLLFLAVLIGGHELAALLERPFSLPRIARRMAAGFAVFAAPVVLYAISDLGSMDGDAEFRSFAGKAHAALFPLINYSWPLDLVTAACCVLCVVLCVARGWCVIPLRVASSLIALAALFLLLPAGFKGTYDLDTRFIIMAAFLLPAALIPLASPRRARVTIALSFPLLFIARMIVVITQWYGWAVDLAAFRAVIAPVQPGNVVMTVDIPRAAGSAHRLSDGTVVDGHLPALLIIEHRAWWPFLFDNLSQQPITTRQPYRAAANVVDNSADPITLLLRGEPDLRPFTHVLVHGPGEIDAEGLVRLAGNQQGTLYAIDWNALSRARPLSPRSDR